MDRTFGVVSRDVLVAGDGLSFLRGIIDGSHPAPPFAGTMDFDLVEADEGRVVFSGRPSPRFFNPLGTIHGGWTATILDSAMACAAHSTLKPGEGYTTLEMKLNYVRPVMPESGTVRCEGRLIHRGGSVITTEGNLVDERGKLLAHGTETCIVLPRKKTEA
ncbi:PaaI family thioesterase [Bosea thiooxidans]|nr:PaaI family thioesterase [Bosea sp. (in: a-proteobacteria)]